MPPSKKSKHHLAKKRMCDFERDLEFLLEKNEFRSLNDLFTSNSFKSITIKNGRRHQQGRGIKVDAFYTTAVARCKNSTTTKAYSCCLKAFGPYKNAGVKKSRVVAEHTQIIPTKRVTRSKSIVVQNSFQHEEQCGADASSPEINEAKKIKPNLTQDEPKKAPRQLELSVPDDQADLPIGLKNVGSKTCYAVSTWRVLSTLDVFYEQLSEVQRQQPENALSLCNICFDLMRSIRSGDKNGADDAFLRMLIAFGELMPDWKDLSQLQDAEEFAESIIGQLQQEGALYGIDLHSGVFGCNAQCNSCTLDQTAKGVIKQTSLQVDYAKKTSEILTEVILQNIGYCAVCFEPCHCISLPSNIFAKINRHNLQSKLLAGAQLDVEEEVKMDLTEELSGSYQLRGAVLYHERLRSDNHYSSLIWHPQSHYWISLDDEDVQKVSRTSAISMMQKNGFILHYALLRQ